VIGGWRNGRRGVGMSVEIALGKRRKQEGVLVD
jgi:hypothetical protein